MGLLLQEKLRSLTMAVTQASASTPGFGTSASGKTYQELFEESTTKGVISTWSRSLD